MLLYATMLEISEKMTKDAFIELVLKWNRESTHPANVIPGIQWAGERNVTYSSDALSLTIEEYRNGNIIAVRYEKRDEQGAIWDTDYIMNFNEMRMSIQLDRSYSAEALFGQMDFSTPHFVTLLIEGGFVKDDGPFPVLREAQQVRDDNVSLLADLIDGKLSHRLPVVYVSKTFDNDDPLDVGWLCSRLKGIAHVLQQADGSSSHYFKEACGSKNEFHGAVGIYYQKPLEKHVRFLYHRDFGVDAFLLEKVVKNVLHYTNIQNIPPLYTWDGVRAALLSDRLEHQRRERAEAELAKDAAQQETDDVYAAFDEDLRALQQQVEALTKANEALRCENQGLRAKAEASGAQPILYSGTESEFYPGEIRDFVLCAINEALKNAGAKTRRADVYKDLLQQNGYQRLSEQRQQTLKALLKGYQGLPRPLRQALMDFGFEITEDGKHYKLTYFGDRRYWFSLPKTPSDYRDGRNASSSICNLIL